MIRKIPISIRILLIILLVYILVKTFFIDISIIDGMSMFPTLEEKELILINKLEKDKVSRGDVIVFKTPSKLYVSKEEYDPRELVATYAKDNIFDEILVKRIIGLPGEHIQIREDRKVYINGEELQEEYILNDTDYMMYAYTDIVIPENTVYVMGDNRNKSTDSRSFGCIPIDKIKGHIIK